MPSCALTAAVQVICQLAPMLSKHLLSVTPVIAQVRLATGSSKDRTAPALHLDTMLASVCRVAGCNDSSAVAVARAQQLRSNSTGQPAPVDFFCFLQHHAVNPQPQVRHDHVG